MANIDANIESTLEILEIANGRRHEVYRSRGVFEAPNWSPDGSFLLINRNGLLYRIAPDGGKPELIDTRFANQCNNDHGISPDGKEVVISQHDPESGGDSTLYILPIGGGHPRKVTHQGPSYWHGWSPDGQRLAYVADREGLQGYKIFSISVNGGEETQLSFGKGLDDGPDYSPDGRYIYYNSYRSGTMQIWRMDSDGANPVQLIKSPHSDWFPHPSPDGKKLVFLRYLEDQGQAHPFGRDVQLMLLDLETQKIKDLTGVFFGGQGTINVPSWSPDSEQFAFVSYCHV